MSKGNEQTHGFWWWVRLATCVLPVLVCVLLVLPLHVGAQEDCDIAGTVETVRDLLDEAVDAEDNEAALEAFAEAEALLAEAQADCRVPAESWLPFEVDELVLESLLETALPGNLFGADATTSTATLAPLPTNTPQPTNTPTLTNTPRPTNTATLTFTPRPTLRPAATRTPRPVPTETPLRAAYADVEGVRGLDMVDARLFGGEWSVYSELVVASGYQTRATAEELFAVTRLVLGNNISEFSTILTDGVTSTDYHWFNGRWTVTPLSVVPPDALATARG